MQLYFYGFSVPPYFCGFSVQPYFCCFSVHPYFCGFSVQPYFFLISIYSYYWQYAESPPSSPYKDRHRPAYPDCGECVPVLFLLSINWEGGGFIKCRCLRTLEWCDKETVTILFVLLLSTLVCFQPTELILGLFGFINCLIFLHPPAAGTTPPLASSPKRSWFANLFHRDVRNQPSVGGGGGGQGEWKNMSAVSCQTCVVFVFK